MTESYFGMIPTICPALWRREGRYQIVGINMTEEWLCAALLASRNATDYV